MPKLQTQHHAIRNGSFRRTQPAGRYAAVLGGRQRRRSRRGAVMVEAAIVMSVFITLTLGAIDLQIGVYRHNTLAQAARHGVRQAVVRGALAPSAMTVWGPATYSGKASDGSPCANAIKPMLVGIPLNKVDIKIEWLDGSNAVGNRVRCSLSAPYTPLLGFFIGYSTFTLKSASTLSIAH